MIAFVAILALGTMLFVVGAICLHVGRQQAPAKAREERDAARAERDDLAREGKRKDHEIARLRGELAVMRGLGQQVMSTAARLVNSYDVPTEAEAHIVKMSSRG